MVPNKPKSWASFWLVCGLSVRLGASRADRQQDQCSWSSGVISENPPGSCSRETFRTVAPLLSLVGLFFNPLMPHSKLLKQSLVTN